MKNIYAWQLALATALGAYGGFPKAPNWWIELSKYRLFQFFTLWLLIYSRNKNGKEYLWTTFIAVIVYSVMYFSNILFCNVKSVSTTKNVDERSSVIDINEQRPIMPPPTNFGPPTNMRPMMPPPTNIGPPTNMEPSMGMDDRRDIENFYQYNNRGETAESEEERLEMERRNR